MDYRTKELYRFFLDKAKHLQNEINWEIKKIGGESMLISREDLIHWVYHSREQVKTYYVICDMLMEKEMGIDKEQILKGLSETIAVERHEIEDIRRKQERERQALKELRTEAEYYQMALDVLGKK